jgi:hypothetical protein
MTRDGRAVPIADSWVFVVFVVFVGMRFIYVVAVVGTAIAVLLVAPVVLIGATSAHADTGVNGYARCLGGDAKPPPPGVDAEDWFPSVHVMANDFDSGDSAAQVVQILVGMGVKQNDAVTQVQCFMANEPRGQGH